MFVWPQKVNLTFNTVPAGLTLYLDGIAKVTPFVYDTLIGFHHAVEARDQTSGGTAYSFASWSDGGAQQHTIVVPSTVQTYTATFNGTRWYPRRLSCRSKLHAPEPQTTVSTGFQQAQAAGNLNVIVVGWNDATSNVVSVTDTAGNAYQLAAPTTRSGGAISQTVYYAKNIVAGTNTVTVTFNTATPYVDVRIAEYTGLDRVNPLDVSASAGKRRAANSGSVTTGSATELIVGAGTTTGQFTDAEAATRPGSSPCPTPTSSRTGSSRAPAATTRRRSTPHTWAMQLVAFRGASQSDWRRGPRPRDESNSKLRPPAECRRRGRLRRASGAVGGGAGDHLRTRRCETDCPASVDEFAPPRSAFQSSVRPGRRRPSFEKSTRYER